MASSTATRPRVKASTPAERAEGDPFYGPTDLSDDGWDDDFVWALTPTAPAPGPVEAGWEDDHRSTPTEGSSVRVDGPTPNGGAYAIRYYRDAEGDPCPADRSVSSEIVEFTAGGEAIHRTYTGMRGGN